MITITGVRLTPVNVARTGGYVCGHVIVELLTDSELIGLGEMSDLQHLPRFHFDVEGLERTLESILVGLSSSETAEIENRLELNFPQGDYIYDKSRAIKCGVDIALWDLRAKALGVPVYELLGGRVRDAVPVAYPLFRPQAPADVDVSLDTIDERLREGFSTFRVYVGRNLDLDRQFLRAAHDRFGDGISIKSLDFSNLLTPQQAIRFVDSVADVPFDLVESPAPAHDVAGLRRAREAMPVPISEHVYSYRWALRLITEGAVDVFNISVIAMGGITAARRILAMAEASGIQSLLGTTQELSIGTSAAAHFGATSPSMHWPGDPVGPKLYVGDVVREAVRYVDGRLEVPDGPGLGMELDPAALAAHAGPLQWADSRPAAAIQDRARPKEAAHG